MVLALSIFLLLWPAVWTVWPLWQERLWVPLFQRSPRTDSHISLYMLSLPTVTCINTLTSSQIHHRPLYAYTLNVTTNVHAFLRKRTLHLRRGKCRPASHGEFCITSTTVFFRVRGQGLDPSPNLSPGRTHTRIRTRYRTLTLTRRIWHFLYNRKISCIVWSNWFLGAWSPNSTGLRPSSFVPLSGCCQRRDDTSTCGDCCAVEQCWLRLGWALLVCCRCCCSSPWLAAIFVVVDSRRRRQHGPTIRRHSAPCHQPAAQRRTTSGTVNEIF